VPSRWLDVRDRTRAATHARVERCRVLVEEAKAARIPASARRRAGHRVKHRPLPDQQHRASSPHGRAGAPLRAARFLFRYRDAPAGMTSSSGRAACLILRARTASAWTPHPPHAAARLSAAASLEARFPQHTPPSRWRRGALACFLPPFRHCVTVRPLLVSPESGLYQAIPSVQLHPGRPATKSIPTFAATLTYRALVQEVQAEISPFCFWLGMHQRSSIDDRCSSLLTES